MPARQTDPSPAGPPLGLLIVVIGATALAAFLMYIDRVCFGILAGPVQADLGLGDVEKGDVLGAFFYTYALLQIPMGALADRYGPRAVLAGSVLAWSVVIAVTGLAESFLGLYLFRLMLGVTEAGAYPAAAGLVKNWAPVSVRGMCSSAVTLGGRLGGAAAPFLTAWLAVRLVGIGPAEWQGNPSGINWRGVLVVYGAVGVLLAAFYWAVVRNHPPGAAAASRRRPGAFGAKLALLSRSRNMWLIGAVQFGVNIGWALLVTLLPTYLGRVHHVPIGEQGRMQSTVLLIGCLGMFLGGPLTDLLRVWLGPRLGRSVPLVVTSCGCAAVMFVVPTLSGAWAVTVALGVMAFLVDMHNPALWSFAQDVGGRHVGGALGWGNMWGNLGAALSPSLLARVSAAHGWDAAFAVGGVAFVAAAACGVFLDARRPLEPEATG